MKSYEKIEMEIICLLEEDIIRTSDKDNVEEMPDFGENGPFGAFNK